MGLKFTPILTKVIDHDWIGDNANNRVIDLGDDYDMIYIWIEEPKAHTDDHFVTGWAMRACYGCLDNSGVNYTRAFAMADGISAQRWQGKMFGVDANKIKLGTSGASTFGSNLLGQNYRLIGFKFLIMQ